VLTGGGERGGAGDGDAAIDGGLAASFDLCRRITRERARNFYYGLRLTPEPRRSAIYAVYAWMRAADDAVDRPGTSDDDRRTALDAFEARTWSELGVQVGGGDCGNGGVGGDGGFWLAFAETVRRYGVDRAVLGEVIQGMRDDLEGPGVFDEAGLERYCYRVASTVGLICVSIWGLRAGVDVREARALAVERGQAFQRTNILRDFAEDFDERPRRVYLPGEVFGRHGITPDELRVWEPPGACRELVMDRVADARARYERSSALDEMIDPACRPTLWAMTRIYRGLLERIASDPSRIVLGERVRLSSVRKIGIAARATVLARSTGSGSVGGVNGSASSVVGGSGGGGVGSGGDGGGGLNGVDRGCALVEPKLSVVSGVRSGVGVDVVCDGYHGPRSVLVVGGGLAGMSCAIRLAEHGVRVTLLETRKKLGGRATSFTDVRTGLMIDNCQHVVLGCCPNYLDLLGRLGSASKITWHRTQYWIEAGGRVSRVTRSGLPAPGHYAPSFARAAFLSASEKLAIGRGLRAILGVDRRALEGVTFEDWLFSVGQPARAIRRFWEPVVVSACNLSCNRVSAASALHVFQEGFLATASGADMGVPSVPLVDLYSSAASKIESAGGRLGASVGEVGARSVVLRSGERLSADRVVLAVPFERAGGLVEQGEREVDRRFDALEGIGHSPILGVHLLFDRPVLPYPHAVLVERGTQWVFRKDGPGAGEGVCGDGGLRAGRMLHAVISGADDWMDLSEGQVVDRVLGDLRACLPAWMGGARLLSARAVKEKRATFAAEPGFEKRRPGVMGVRGLGGILLAGDYTTTGWPATMEGAVRSGYAAAGAAMTGDPAGWLIGAERPARLVRMLGLSGV